MSDFVDMFRAQRELRQDQGFENRLRAESDYPEARRRLKAARFHFVRHTDAHYTLRKPGAWLINVYPGNRRISAGFGNPPYLKLPADWTLLDVANAAIGLKGETTKRPRKKLTSGSLERDHTGTTSTSSTAPIAAEMLLPGVLKRTPPRHSRRIGF